jgi:hypothetical protein
MAGRNITATSHSVNATREKANASVTPQNVKAEGGDKATNSASWSQLCGLTLWPRSQGSRHIEWVASAVQQCGIVVLRLVHALGDGPHRHRLR